jgi:hypothetical protein
VVAFPAYREEDDVWHHPLRRQDYKVTREVRIIELGVVAKM